MFSLLLPGGAHVATFTISLPFLGGYSLFKMEKIYGRAEGSVASRSLAGHQVEPTGKASVSIHAIPFHALCVVG